MWKVIWFILVVLSIAILGALVVGIYYNLIRLRREVEDSWSYLDDELEVRIILVDNLINTIKKYIGRRNSTLKEVVKAKSMLEYAETIQDKWQANNRLTTALEELFVLLDDYPDLITSNRFEKLTIELEDNGYLLAEYRYLYNEMAYVYNSKLQIFPNNAVANYFGLEDAEYFETEGELSHVKDLDSGPGREEK
jgi:LemA protein